MAVFSAIAAGKAKKAQKASQKQLDRSIADRQEIINPYANVTDLSNMISNPFANLQVATGAAEMQAEEADIALASTLDTLRARCRRCRGNSIGSSGIKKSARYRCNN